MRKKLLSVALIAAIVTGVAAAVRWLMHRKGDDVIDDSDYDDDFECDEVWEDEEDT